jgi:hypothetical protein
LISELLLVTETLFALGGDVETLTVLSWKVEEAGGEGGVGFMGAGGACGSEVM